VRQEASRLTVLRLLAADALVWLLGVGLLPILGVAPTKRELARRLPLGLLVGLAAIGSAGALLELVHVPLSPLLVAVVAAVVLAVGIRRLDGGPALPWPRVGRDEVLLVALSATVLGVVGYLAARAFLVVPLVSDDGWAIWAMKARALADLGWADPRVFAGDAYDGAHLDYPLALPSINAYALRAAGSFDSRIVVLQSLVIGLAGLLALWGLLEDRVRPSVLLPVLAALAAAPALHTDLATAYADIPLALFVSAGLVAAARWLLEPRACWLTLATLFLVAAALTKNEGLLYAAAVEVALLLTVTGRRRVVLRSAAVVLLVWLPWFGYTKVFGLSGREYDLSRSVHVAWVAARADRGADAIVRLLSESLDPIRFALLLPITALAVVFCVLAGSRRLSGFVIAFAVTSLAGLAWIYTISPLDLDLYLDRTAERVVSVLVFACAACVPLLVTEISPRPPAIVPSTRGDRD
jgi:hypothetical protein